MILKSLVEGCWQVVWLRFFYLLYFFFFFPDFEAILELDEAEVRSYFPESWLWEVHQVSPRYYFSQISYQHLTWSSVL